MADFSVHNASELSSDERIFVERWLGRPLSADETISLNLYRPHFPPSPTQRKALHREIVTKARQIGERAGQITEQDADSLVDEAFEQVRGNPA
jgi:hypothetical protein